MSEPKEVLKDIITVQIKKEVTIKLKEEDVNAMWYIANLAEWRLAELNPQDPAFRVSDREPTYTSRLHELTRFIKIACR